MTSPLYKAFATDPDLEKEGVVLNYGPNSKGVDFEIRVARAGGANTKFAKVLEHKMRPYKRLQQSDALPPEVLERVMRETYAESVILGWTGGEDKDGNEMPFNVANCVKLFTDLPDLFRDVIDQTQKAALFRAELRENDAGN